MEYTLPYHPRHQFIPFHKRSNRWSLMVCHRRAGKTVACVAELVLRALYTTKKKAKYAYIGPFRAQAKEVAWEYLKDMTEGFRKGPPRESELRVRLPNDATITLYGADNPDALRGLYFDGIVVDEFGDCRPGLWGEVLLPTLMDRRGWAVFIGTPKGKNHFYHMYNRSKREDGWFSFTLKATESGILSDRDLEDMRQEMTEDQWQQEMECSFDAAVPGTYYSKVIAEVENTNFGEYPHNPLLPVYCSADLGYSDSTAWWFWQLDHIGPYMIDYEEFSGQPLSFYFDMLKEKGYKYDFIYLPHDAKAATLQTGRSTIEQFLQSGFPCKLVPKLGRQHGIDAARSMIPKTRFDANKCYKGIEALRAYRRQFNDKTQQYADTPLHDWASNGADSFRYYSLVTKDSVEIPDEAPKKVEPTGIRLDDLWEDNDDGWKSDIIRI